MRIHRAIGRLALNRRLSIAVIGLGALASRLALMPILGLPHPQGHDEFSYLLAADTFAHGRLANPIHPMWMHFETFHVIHQPTYSSIYPPAEGLVLAAGQLLGHPWIGQWLITGLMCAVICWMLQGWLPAKWAFYGAVVALLRLAVMSYWMDGYWSASVVALGGALVLGALPRIKARQRSIDAIWLAIGVAVLANSRPYEGLVLALIVAAALLAWTLGPQRPGRTVVVRRIAVPVAVVLVTVGLATGLFYHRVTGDAFQLTYKVDSRIYNPVPAFLWQHAGVEPAYRHETMRSFYERDLAQYTEHRTFGGFLRYCARRIAFNWAFYLGPLAVILLLPLLWCWRDRRLRFPLVAGGVFLVALMAETWGLPHYAAPAAALLFLLVSEGARRLALCKLRGLAIGRVLVQLIPIVMVAELVMRLGAFSAHVPWACIWPCGSANRAAVSKQLAERPGKHVVIVEYGPSHDLDFEWVQNGADIDGAKVIWARDMGPKENLELRRHFPDRQAWTVRVGGVEAPRLIPY